MNNHILSLILPTLLIAGFSGCNKSLEVSEGTETGNGTKLVGVVANSAGTPVGDVSLNLYRAGSIPAELIATETSNGEGKFQILDVEPGTYNLEFMDPATNTSLLLSGIATTNNIDSLDLGSNSLMSPGTWIFRLPDSLKIPGSSIGIPGTSIRATINSGDIDREYIEIKNIFAGTYEEVSWSPTGDFEETRTLNLKINIAESQTHVTGDYHGWTYTRRLGIHPSFLTENLPHFPLAVRLDASNFNFSEAAGAGSDLRVSNSVGKALSFRIENWDVAQSRAMLWILLDTVLAGSENILFLHWGNNHSTDTPPGWQLPAELTFAGVWNLSENPGATPAQFSDGSGENTGTWQGSLSSGEFNGTLGPAVDFNGIDQFIETSVLDTNPSEFSLSMWFKTASSRSGNLIQYHHSLGFDRHIWMDTAGRLNFGVFEETEFIENRGGGDYETRVITSPDSYNDDAWHFVTGTFEMNDFRLYVDAELVASTDTVLYASNHYARWRIGSGTVGVWDPNLVNGFFEGLLDEVRVRYAISTPERIRLDYETQRENGSLVVIHSN